MRARVRANPSSVVPAQTMERHARARARQPEVVVAENRIDG
jgi:hypothetical protein